MSRRAGAVASMDEVDIYGTLAKRIETNRERLRAAEELRAVIVRPA